MIEKKATDPRRFKILLLYYDRARDAMADIVKQYFNKGYKKIFLPGYIGWSPKEGSGIFDPINDIPGLNRYYYKMTRDLQIDVELLDEMLVSYSIVLLVNYFGFRDDKVNAIIDMAHKKSCVVIEDNAHGFFTYFCGEKTQADATFFSFHKMFPFEKGGGLIVRDEAFDNLNLRGLFNTKEFNPFEYDYNSIAAKRIENYSLLARLMEEWNAYFIPLHSKEQLANNIPQTFPIIIKKGNRDMIYEIMNRQGFGVVSLYHTMIKELQNKKHEEALWLSKRILNLPVHQDCDPYKYKEMLKVLVEACLETA